MSSPPRTVIRTMPISSNVSFVLLGMGSLTTTA